MKNNINQHHNWNINGYYSVPVVLGTYSQCLEENSHTELNCCGSKMVMVEENL